MPTFMFSVKHPPFAHTPAPHALMRWSCYTLAIILTIVLAVMFVVLDPISGYKICFICLCQRLLLVTLVLGFILFPKLHTKPSSQRYLATALAVLSSLGVGLSLYHGYLIATQADDACPLHLKKTPAVGLQRLWQHFEWIPCAQEQSTLLGLPFPWWALGLFITLLCFCLWLFFIIKPRSYPPKDR